MMPATIPQGGWRNHAVFVPFRDPAPSTLTGIPAGEAGEIVSMEGRLWEPLEGQTGPSFAPHR
jgi:hypothetical protein